MASMDFINHDSESHSKFNYVTPDGSSPCKGKTPLNKLKRNGLNVSSEIDCEKPCSSKSNEDPSSDGFEMSLFDEVEEITEKSRQICMVISQIRETFYTLFDQSSHKVPLRQNKRSKKSVVVRHQRMSLSMKIKFELYGGLCINWLKNTIRLIKSFYEIWIPKAQQNVLELKFTATKLEESDEHISKLLYVKDSKILSSWEESEQVFLQHAISDLSTYILKHKTYRYKEKLHQEYTIIEQNIYALLDSLHNTLSVLKRHYKIFEKLKNKDVDSEIFDEGEEDWVTEEIIDVSENKTYTCEVEM